MRKISYIFFPFQYLFLASFLTRTQKNMILDGTRKAHIFGVEYMELSKYHQISPIFENYGYCHFAFAGGTARVKSIFGFRTTNDVKKLVSTNYFHIRYMIIISQKILGGGHFTHVKYPPPKNKKSHMFGLCPGQRRQKFLHKHI